MASWIHKGHISCQNSFLFKFIIHFVIVHFYLDGMRIERSSAPWLFSMIICFSSIYYHKILQKHCHFYQLMQKRIILKENLPFMKCSFHYVYTCQSCVPRSYISMAQDTIRHRRSWVIPHRLNKLFGISYKLFLSLACL